MQLEETADTSDAVKLDDCRGFDFVHGNVTCQPTCLAGLTEHAAEWSREAFTVNLFKVKSFDEALHLDKLSFTFPVQLWYTLNSSVWI